MVQFIQGLVAVRMTERVSAFTLIVLLFADEQENRDDTHEGV